MELPTVVAYPLAGGQGEKPKARLPKRKMRGSCHQRLFGENIRKTKKRGLRISKIKKVSSDALCVGDRKFTFDEVFDANSNQVGTSFHFTV